MSKLVLEENNELPLGWSYANLEDVSNIVRGVTFPKNSKSKMEMDEHIACLRTTNVQQQVEWDDLWFIPKKFVKRQEQLIQKDDILISTANSLELVGKVALVKNLPCQSTLGAFISLIRTHPEINPIFIYFQLDSYEIKSKMRTLASTTTNISNISSAKLNELILKIPPLNEQKRIVTKIEELFSLIESVEKNFLNLKRLLIKYKKSFLESSLKGNLTHEWRKSNAKMGAITKSLITHNAILPHAIENWVMKRIEDVVDNIVDCPHSTPHWTEKGLLCARTSDFKPFHLNTSTMRFVSKKSYDERIKKLKPISGDVLYSREGAILGIACQIPPATILCMGQRMMLFRCSTEYLDGKFLTAVLNSEIVLSKVRELTTGTASPHLNVRDIKLFYIPIPPIMEQREIISLLELHHSLIDGMSGWIENNMRHLKTLKHQILQMTFEGKLVPQDPNDEPAEILLQKIKQEKERLQNQKVIKAKPIKARRMKNVK